MAAWLGGATSSCLCSPLGRSACTNKPTPGLWSNGNQTCSRTKSPMFFSFLFFALPPTPTPIPPSLNNQRSVDTHSSWRTHFNYSKQTWKKFPFPLSSFPTQQFYMTFQVCTSTLTFLILKESDSSDLYLSPQTHFLSLLHTFFITLPHSLSLCHMCTHRASHASVCKNVSLFDRVWVHFCTQVHA